MEAIGEIVANLGGTLTADTVVPALEELKEAIGSGMVDPEAIAAAVNGWLDAHPEATTTVTPGSITLDKLASDAHCTTTADVLALYE